MADRIVFSAVIFQISLFTPPLGDIQILSIGIGARCHQKLNRREKDVDA